MYQKIGWNFNWRSEYKLTDRAVHKLSIVGNEQVVQGLVSISNVESAPLNLGKKKLYEGVPGNLFAFTCKQSWDKGYQGVVAFQSKTNLITHYEHTLGAVHVGNYKMLIFPKEALKLIKKYYPEL